MHTILNVKIAGHFKTCRELSLFFVGFTFLLPYDFTRNVVKHTVNRLSMKSKPRRTTFLRRS